MKNTTRRVFVMHVAAAGAAMHVSVSHAQAAAPKVDDKDPQAVALGYSSDTTKVDPKKFPKHTAEQKCSACQLYAGKPKEATGPCPLFAGKQVSANGWCNAWSKKA